MDFTLNLKVAEYHLLNEKDLFQDATVDTCGIEEAMTCFTNWDEAIKEMEKKNAKKKVEKPEVKPEPSLKVNKNRQEAVLEHLKTHGSINGFEARDKYGCTFLPCIIRDLRKNGYKITTSKTRNSKENNPIFDREVSCCTYYLSQEDVVESKNLKPENMTVKTSMKEVILDHLKKHKTITSAIAMNKYKCLNLCTIIGTLRDEGYNISRSRERKSSDYNTASNRNNSYVVYTLEDKVRKTKSYTINCVCEGAVSMLMEPFAPAYKTIGDAINTAVNKATKLAEYCNTFYGTSTVDFIVNNSTDGVWLRKRETIKKLFRKKYNLTTLAHFTFGEIEVDI